MVRNLTARDPYRELLRLPAGQITEVFATLCRHRWPQGRKAIMSAIRECPLVPLAPLHQAASSRRQPIRFPWGRKWRDRLLEQEQQYQTDRKGGKL